MIPSESMEPTLNGCAGCTGDRIVVEKLSYDWGKPRPGDVVVFVGPTSSWNEEYHSTRSNNPIIHGLEDFGSWLGVVPPDENDLVKRVIATGGQTVQCCDTQGRVEVNGKPLNEPYIQADYNYPPLPAGTLPCTDADPYRNTRCFGPYTVPSGNLWVMGDNRSNSADSRYHVSDRYHGTVPVSDVRGKAVFKIWPVKRIGNVSSPNPQ
jgi:signal peptidase I